jgi:PPM family protein phosphatase
VSSAPQELSVQSSALSDRGLNERRPLNEDAFFADDKSRTFAVADGVGGAEAGEVASQTAIEVLSEAFSHHTDDADVEDLMELAIQRANASIHQLAQESSKFSMMATTIVALHIHDNVATIGHVGDSRLYRLTPEGDLLRETEDHSVVEEEVRAGRMTREQAANHPSKNVISRALGADESVEVDMKVLEIEDGTEFLLCSDGITRHVSDAELRQLLIANDDLEQTCGELKRRCYERGAEDNLTVVVVRAGQRIGRESRFNELDPTISPETEEVAAMTADLTPHVAAKESGEYKLVPPSRTAFPGAMANTSTDTQPAISGERPIRIAENEPRKSGSFVARFFVLLLFIAAVAGAFYAGTRYKGPIPFLKPTVDPVPAVTPTPVVQEDPFVKFEKARREVDRAPAEWITGTMQKELASQGIAQPLDSKNAEFLYLYGRASLLSGNLEEAAKAFEAAIAIADQDPSDVNAATIRKEATIGLAALTLRTNTNRANALKRYDEMMTKPNPVRSP